MSDHPQFHQQQQKAATCTKAGITHMACADVCCRAKFVRAYDGHVALQNKYTKAWTDVKCDLQVPGLLLLRDASGEVRLATGSFCCRAGSWHGSTPCMINTVVLGCSLKCPSCGLPGSSLHSRGPQHKQRPATTHRANGKFMQVLANQQVSL